MPSALRSKRQEQRELSAEFRAQHKTWAEIASIFRDRYHLNTRAAMRVAHNWSQQNAAERWNNRWPADQKTFKNFSYWELWPASTGHAPSLDVLTKLAELYECSVSDLLTDCGDFRSSDPVFHDARTLAGLYAEASSVTDLVSQLESTDLPELARLAASWADRFGTGVSRRALLLKLSAGLALAAASPALADEEIEPTTPPIPDGSFAGLWHSRYVYTSTGRGSDFIGEHHVVLRQTEKHLLGQSLPAANGSVLTLDLTVSGPVCTGIWKERTSPAGYYRGSVYHGAIQLLIDPMGKTMQGKWIGFDREFGVDSNTWTLHWIAEATSKAKLRDYHLKAQELPESDSNG